MNKIRAIKAIKLKDEELKLIQQNHAKAIGREKQVYFKILERFLEERKVLMDLRDGKTQLESNES